MAELALDNFSFQVVKKLPNLTIRKAHFTGYLVADNWDDWFKYATAFNLIIVDGKGDRHDIGAVKIGKFNLVSEAYYRADPPAMFTKLDDIYFSLGQDDTYYEELNNLGTRLASHILSCLHDIVVDEPLYKRALKEDVTRRSLLRSIARSTLEDQFRRIARGDARLTPFDFSYQIPKFFGALTNAPSLTFKVRPDSAPPTNVHVLIGRNGVGKTHILRSMERAIMDGPSRSNGRFQSGKEQDVKEIFHRLVSVTFSAFDPFQNIKEKQDETEGIKYSYIGLQRPQTKDGKAQPPKSPHMLARDFKKSFQACHVLGKSRRWKEVIKVLESDPLIRDSNVTSLAYSGSDDGWEQKAQSTFNRFSSGHKIVILTITKLVETVDERTLVLMDEPEGYLHPPLLAAFIRAVSSLLTQRNGVGVIATHSPVVLQEAPKSCVWKLQRSGRVVVAERPTLNTFGENIGVLTRDVFGLEVTESGFHQLISEQVQEEQDLEDLDDYFDDELGHEARGLGFALIEQAKIRVGK